MKCEGKKTINEHEFRQKDMDPWDPTNETNARLHRRQEPSADGCGHRRPSGVF